MALSVTLLFIMIQQLYVNSTLYEIKFTNTFIFFNSKHFFIRLLFYSFTINNTVRVPLYFNLNQRFKLLCLTLLAFVNSLLLYCTYLFVSFFTPIKTYNNVNETIKLSQYATVKKLIRV